MLNGNVLPEVELEKVRFCDATRVVTGLVDVTGRTKGEYSLRTTRGLTVVAVRAIVAV